MAFWVCENSACASAPHILMLVWVLKGMPFSVSINHVWEHAVCLSDCAYVINSSGGIEPHMSVYLASIMVIVIELHRFPYTTYMYGASRQRGTVGVYTVHPF